jgi:FkbM family methyltransferase
MPLFIPILKKNGFLDRIHMTVCNVGSRKLGEHDDYASQGWHYFAPNLSIYGFDADADACDEANTDLQARQINWYEVHVPLALGKANEERTLYVTTSPMCSSLYPPNEPYLSRFAGLPELVNLDFSFVIETTTLDDFCVEENVKRIDFLQVDVQGADLDVLAGATQIIEAGTLAIQIEVKFSHLYKDQPLFADVDSFFRMKNFSLFDLSTFYRLRTRSPIRSSLRSG